MGSSMSSTSAMDEWKARKHLARSPLEDPRDSTGPVLVSGERPTKRHTKSGPSSDFSGVVAFGLGSVLGGMFD